ncbi:cytochrome O ubiquinol oxidase [Buchnera aphidicola (Nipponaphis monzeni)]|uniref:Ubiquinol oxidase subunit 2 n=1 Tax=Buchnera aphidicola (Nipponaphis monzeni) TaxID=2495405 RepID=A0A455TAM6_9GAMM|nr:ubiquinol oxidase subunit II [Buchnera aphidicola]BBI01360.1 cytochrome O ubiquinol oxidase [Buchnera aphidicola (Nipponaphis monzeni)]
MNYMFINRFSKILFLISISTLLNTEIYSSIISKGYIREEENSLIFIAFILMLIIVIPVITMTIVFFLKYSSDKNHVQYSPDWKHSKIIEIFIWGIPILIISILACISWKSTYKLDPNKSISYFNTKPITIDVIALDWKWLFVYPQQNIATINEIAFPVNTPINFRITSNSVMNSLFIPQLGSQMYAMPGMQTNLHLIANISGHCKGISANFSGLGFSRMKFIVIVKKSSKSFNNWVKKVRNSPTHLNSMQDFQKISISEEYSTVKYFSNVKSQLFIKIINTFH